MQDSSTTTDRRQAAPVRRRSSLLPNLPPLSPMWRGVVHSLATVVFFAAAVLFTTEQVHPIFTPAAKVAETPANTVSAELLRSPWRIETARLTGFFSRYTKVPGRAESVANAVVRESHQTGLSPALLAGIVMIEDSNLDPQARSSVGAVGVMQVMPFHSGKWGCASSDLTSVDANVCHGVRILLDVVRKSPNLQVALLRYNGCVHGKTTKNCHTYPGKVMRAAQLAQVHLETPVSGE